MPCYRGMHGTVRYAALALAVAACGGPVTGPRPVAARLANPATTLNQLQAISAVTNTPLFESFTVLAPRFTPASATGSVALALALDFAARYSRWRRSEPRTAHHRVPTPSATAPASSPGTTFVWDPDTRGYIAGGDSARMTTDLRLASDGETVRATGDVTIDTTSRIGSGQMTVSVNDCAFATITLGGPDLVFDPAPGVTLSTEDETTLRALFSTSFELYGTERVLLIPVPLSRSSPPVPLSTIPQAGPSLARVPRPPFVS